MAGDFDAMIDHIRDLQLAFVTALQVGAEAGADLIEVDMADTTAYVGMSGATRASTIGYVATADDTNDGEPIAAYNTAAGMLQNFTGHDGQPHLGGVTGPNQNEVWIVATVPTNYSISLETENGGQKAFIADTLHQDAPRVFQMIVQALKGAFH